uniref:hypothetical protein n=1 Tax=Nocardiopsis eucommiae TaxID=2831970 RepID=UPI003D75AF7F
MFDLPPAPPEARVSVVEAGLSKWLEDNVRPLRVELLIPRRTVLVEVVREPVEVAPETARLAGLLEAGADHLQAARAAQQRAAREAAAQARALAAFAAARPAADLDRPEAEVGAA